MSWLDQDKIKKTKKKYDNWITNRNKFSSKIKPNRINGKIVLPLYLSYSITSLPVYL